MPPPFHAEQIGSLLRPESLLQAHSEAAAAQSSSSTSFYSTIYSKNAATKGAEEKAIKWVVEQQLILGIRPIVSGEYERQIFYGGFFEKLHGFEVKRCSLEEDGPLKTGYPLTPILLAKGVTERAVAICTGKISLTESPYLENWKLLRSLVPEENWKDCKITIPSISYQHIQLKSGHAYDSKVYSSDKEYFTDLAEAYRQEIKTLYDAGIRSIQIDDPNLTFFSDSGFLAGCKTDGVDTDKLLNLYIWAHNLTLVDKPKDLHIGIHLCRGNFAGSTHFAEGSYERIAEKVFQGLEYDTFYLEYDSVRAGDFQPLRHLPVGKNVILGLVSTKTPAMEDLDTLRARVFEAADVIAEAQGRKREEVLQDLGVSPQCGFSSASSGGGVGVTMEVMWKKLELVRDLAKDIWG
jgi:methionine synthase II (cobalamin-independent)